MGSLIKAFSVHSFFVCQNTPYFYFCMDCLNPLLLIHYFLYGEGLYLISSVFPMILRHHYPEFLLVLDSQPYLHLLVLLFFHILSIMAFVILLLHRDCLVKMGFLVFRIL